MKTSDVRLGWYLLRDMRTEEWPYSTSVMVGGPYQSIEELNRSWAVNNFQGEIKARRWDGEKWQRH